MCVLWTWKDLIDQLCRSADAFVDFIYLLYILSAIEQKVLHIAI